MAYLKTGFAGVAVGVLMGSMALSDGLTLSGIEAEKVAGTDRSDFQTFVLAETRNPAEPKQILRGRAFIDRVAGVTCEWTERDVVRPNGKGGFGVVAQISDDIGCIGSIEVPKKWDKGMQTQTRVHREYVQDSRQWNVLYDKATVLHGQLTDLILRSWNSATQEVCLRTAISSPLPDGTENVFVKDWGCFPFFNKGYVDSIQDVMGRVPA